MKRKDKIVKISMSPAQFSEIVMRKLNIFGNLDGQKITKIEIPSRYGSTDDVVIHLEPEENANG